MSDRLLDKALTATMAFSGGLGLLFGADAVHHHHEATNADTQAVVQDETDKRNDDIFWVCANIGALISTGGVKLVLRRASEQ